MNLNEALRMAAQEAAQTLGLELGFEGEPFVVPACPHLRCRISVQSAKAAALGTDAPMRIDGALEIILVTFQGVSEEQAAYFGSRINALFPPGLGIEVKGAEGEGEAVFSAPRTAQTTMDGGRLRLGISLSFYAILFPCKGV